jgi:DNA primase
MKKKIILLFKKLLQLIKPMKKIQFDWKFYVNKYDDLKYINSKENILFSKKNTLYNISNIKKNSDHLFIVEGYLDAISLNQYHEILGCLY